MSKAIVQVAYIQVYPREVLLILYPCVLRWANTLLLKFHPFAGSYSLREEDFAQ